MVAPFLNTRGDSGLAWLSGGIMDCLIAGLGRLEGYEIVHRHTVTSAVDIAPFQAAFVSDAALLGAAREAGASYLVTGSFTASGTAVRIACELDDLRKDVVVGSWTRDLTDLEREFFPAVDAIAADLAGRLGASRVPNPPGADHRGFDTQSVVAMEQFEKGIEGFERGDLPAARAAFAEAVAADSTFARAYLYLGLSATELADCESFMTQAMAYRHGAPAPTPELIAAQWNDLLGRDTEAAAQYEAILAAHPEEMLARNSLANLYLRRREWAKAIGEFSAARARNPFDYSYFPHLTIAYVEIGQRDEALRMTRAWRAREPDQAAPLQWTIQLNQTLGHYLPALDLCDSLAALAPGSDLADREVILVLLGRLAAAETVVRRWQEEPGSFSRSKPLVQMALIERERQQLARGATLAREAVAIQDDFYNRWVAGRLAAAVGDFATAEADARAIGEYFGNDAGDSTAAEALAMRRFYFNLEAEIALARGDAPGAVEKHARALRYSSQVDDPPFRTPYGRALLAAGDTTQAVAAFERVLAFNPNYPEALLLLGSAALARGDRPRAREAVERLEPLWKDADPDFAAGRELEELLAALERH
jgi:tetratricopeptide (TPR) repeat protein